MAHDEREIETLRFEFGLFGFSFAKKNAAQQRRHSTETAGSGLCPLCRQRVGESGAREKSRNEVRIARTHFCLCSILETSLTAASASARRAASCSCEATKEEDMTE